jgi:outer membrane protein assembly factor BamB
MIPRRLSRPALLFAGALAVLGVLAAAWIVVGRLTDQGASAVAGTGAAVAVDVRLRTVDGDTGHPLEGVEVRCRVEALAGARDTAVRSDAEGIVTLRDVEPDATLTIRMAAPAGYEAFTVEMTVEEAAVAALGGGSGVGVAAGVTATIRGGGSESVPGGAATDTGAGAAGAEGVAGSSEGAPAGSPGPQSAGAAAATSPKPESAAAHGTPASGPAAAAGTAAAIPAAPLPLYKRSEQWLTWGHTADRRRVGPAVGIPDGPPIWTRFLKYNIEYPPALAYGLAVFGSYRGRLYAVRQSDGREVWSHQPGNQRAAGKFANQVAVSSWTEGSGGDARRVARVFYANLNGVVGALDLFTGDPVWRRVSGKAPGTDGRTLVFRSFEASPLVVGSTVYVATRYHRADSEAGLWALDRRNGLPRWFCKLGTTDRSKIGASPTYSHGRVFTASYDGSVFAVDARSGKLLWRRYIGGEFYSSPTVVGPHLYIGNKTDGSLYCLRVRDGSSVWSSVLGSSVYSSPAVAGGAVFVGTSVDFVAVSESDGAVLWRVPTAKVFGSASVLGDVVYFSDLGTTYGADVKTGKIVWKWGAGRYSPVTATRRVIVVCGRQRLYAFRPAAE